MIWQIVTSMPIIMMKMGRMTLASYFDGQDVAYSYQNGLLTQVTDDLGVTSYQYDSQGRPIQVVNPDGQIVGYS